MCKKFSDSKLFINIIVVSHKDFIEDTRELITGKNINIVEGGISRQKSVQNGLNEAKKYTPKMSAFTMLSDLSFQLTFSKIILNGLDKYDGVIPSINVYDSVRYILKKNFKDINREHLKLIQTPQGFKFNSIFEAHQKYKKNNSTDDSLMLLYKINKNIKLIDGEKFNFKITTKDDLEFGKLLFEGKLI